MRKAIAVLFALGLLASSHTSVAEEAINIDRLQFKSIFATRADEPDFSYSILGCGAILAIRAMDSDSVVSSWLRSHPRAKVVKVSEMSPMMRDGTGTSIYIWVIDGKDNLNTYLVREGIFPAGVMYDSIDKVKQLEQERAIPPSEEPHLRRLVSDNRYHAFIKEINDAEKLAKAEKKGIWSDSNKQERETQGIE